MFAIKKSGLRIGGLFLLILGPILERDRVVQIMGGTYTRLSEPFYPVIRRFGPAFILSAA